MTTLKDGITIEESVQYQQLKNKIEPSQNELDIEWLGADIAIPAEIIEGKDCNEQDIDIHIYGKTSSVTRVLSLEQAKGFLEELLEAVRAFEPDYMLAKNKGSTEQTLEIEPVSLLPSQGDSENGNIIRMGSGFILRKALTQARCTCLVRLFKTKSEKVP